MQNQQAFFRAAPFAVYILFLAFGYLLAPALNHIGIHDKWLYLIKIITALAVLVYFLRHYIELDTRPPLVDFLYAAVSGLIVFVVWIFPYPDWLVAGANANIIDPTLGQSQLESTIWLFTRVMGAALVVPIIEELFWRSYIMRRYDGVDFLRVNPENLSGFAYVGSACLFALEHKLWLPGLFAGMVFGELYKTYKNLWVPIFAHAVTNGALGTWVVLTGNWHYW